MGNTQSALEGDASRPKFKRHPKKHTLDSGARAKVTTVPEARVTVHRPGHLYSHSIGANDDGSDAGTGESTPEHSSRRDGTMDVSEYKGVVLAGANYARMANSESSFGDSSRGSSQADFSAVHSDGTYEESNFEDVARDLPARADSPTAPPVQTAFRFPRIDPETANNTTEHAIKTPRAKDVSSMHTPRGSMADGNIVKTPQPGADSFPRLQHRASLYIDDDALLGSVDDSSVVQPGAAHDSDKKRALKTYPSFLKIPTALPRFHAQQEGMPSGDGVSNLLDIWPMPMYSGSGTLSSTVHAQPPPSSETSPTSSLKLESQHDIASLRVPSTRSTGSDIRRGRETERLEAPSEMQYRQAQIEQVQRALEQAALSAPEPQQEAAQRTRVNLMWRGKGKHVYVTGTFADEWRSKIPLRQLRPNTPFIGTLYLPPGTHRFKFIVDDRWRVSRDMNTASDGDGTLVNYVEISSSAQKDNADSALHMSSSSSKSKRESSVERMKPDTSRFNDPAWASAMADLKMQQRTSRDASGEWDMLTEELPGTEENHWTGEVPSAVELAQETEEALHEHEMGADAAELLPSPPQLPRQLEKVILNSSPATSGAINTMATLVDDNSVLPAPNHAVLHHLAASAIRNGVLAIGTVTRM
ncbi:hypothetical protein MVES_003466 [Malassezia vespertilionis]|uniref:Association with the SNF1 complex (ASC) domain-containing protein n=1 Tax=Malassezia vespertilionis TaxID=2020962 RepID=A0A2N1J7Z5_9BASI|nr:hypothetical protein MVES_003466 [Malassezia vespertilionis]